MNRSVNDQQNMCIDTQSLVFINGTLLAPEPKIDNKLSSGVLKLGDYGTVVICLISMLFGVTGSVYVSARIIIEPRLKSFRYFFVANQCVVDFCTTFFLAGSRLLLFYEMITVSVRCRALYTLYAIAEYVSPMILLLLSVERFIITVYPLHKDRFLKKKNYLVVIAFLWLSTAALSLGFILGSEACESGDNYYCHLQIWNTNEYLSELILCLVCFIFPFSAMLILYAAIAVKAVIEMKEVDRLTLGNQSTSPCNDGNRKVYKLAKTFFIVSITVAIIRLPKNVIQLLIVLDSVYEQDPTPFNKGVGYYLFWNWGVLMPYLSSAVTPWVYILMSPFMNKPIRNQRENVRKISSLLQRTQRRSKTPEDVNEENVLVETPQHLIKVEKKSDAEETNF